MRKKNIDSSDKSGSILKRDKYYWELFRRNFLRLALTYLAPLILLIVYFHLQYRDIYRQGRQTHLKAIAEYQANTLDLFLRERVVNLRNIIEDPKFQIAPTKSTMVTYLDQLHKNSGTFFDIGYFDATAIQKSYAGPLEHLADQDYSRETWFINLKSNEDDFIITDIYLGFRQKPHFTIGVKRLLNEKYVVLRATLDPEKFYDYIVAQEGSKEVNISIVNQEGYYQMVTPHEGSLLENSSITPPFDNKIGIESVNISGSDVEFAYSWLRTANWAVIVQWPDQGSPLPIFRSQLGLTVLSIFVLLLSLAIVIIRTRKVVVFQLESELNKAQFEHAAKLASVGELSAGVAHEINNPLAVISTEVGLIKDMLDPSFGENTSTVDILPHLESIDEEVFRCRDITRKLMSFVRRTDIKLKPYNVNQLIDEIVDAFWKQEMELSNIEIIKNYQVNIPEIITDANQIKQVFLNILNNAHDAISPPGCITITTSTDQDGNMLLAFADTGKGITKEDMDKIFTPFFTTKEAGKGTGLGLSVSSSIIKSMGGHILVESIPKKGTVFTIVLPIKS
ncbi:MAG: histidine kinase [Dehalococcoidia bacterium]|nr:MAG: histidine kinase [Dehalococcoidia bacterium]